jgi:hypothetical protein
VDDTGMNELPADSAMRAPRISDAALEATGRQLASPWVLLGFLQGLRRLQSVADFGCGRAYWLHAAHALGVRDIRGFDNSELPLEARELRREEFVAADLGQPLDTGRKFDLALCLEVGALVPRAAAPVLVRNLCAASDWVLFGSALPRQGGAGHVNENWIEYWAALFAQSGFLCYDLVRARFWHDTRVAFYYRQNTCLYVRPGAHYALKARGYQPTNCPPSMIHPETFLTVLANGGSNPLDLVQDIRAFYRSAGVAPAEAPPAGEAPEAEPGGSEVATDAANAPAGLAGGTGDEAPSVPAEAAASKEEAAAGAATNGADDEVPAARAEGEVAAATEAPRT